MADPVDAAVTLAKLITVLLSFKSPATKKSTGAPASVPDFETIPVPGARYMLGAFSTRNEHFYKHVCEIHDLIHHYVARPSARKPLNLLISAPPGSGKSFLVKQLLASKDSKGPGVPCLELNVANIAKRSDLGPAWTFIRTMEDNRITPCVFFDEVDATVEGEYLLKDLIMPMYDGAVIHDGAKLRLGPAVFIFAGSKLFEASPAEKPLKKQKGAARTVRKDVKFSEWRISKEAAIRALGAPPPLRRASSKERASITSPAHAVPKIRDFLDRIDRCIIFPDATVAFEGMDKDVKWLETMDLVLSMIRRNFGHLVGVEPAAAAALAVALEDGSSKRSAERLIFTSTLTPGKTIFEFSDLPWEARNRFPSDARTKLEKEYPRKAFKLD